MGYLSSVKRKNPAAVALGKMGKNVARNFSAEELEKRRARMVALNKKRAGKSE